MNALFNLSAFQWDMTYIHILISLDPSFPVKQVGVVRLNFSLHNQNFQPLDKPDAAVFDFLLPCGMIILQLRNLPLPPPPPFPSPLFPAHTSNSCTAYSFSSVPQTANSSSLFGDHNTSTLLLWELIVMVNYYVQTSALPTCVTSTTLQIFVLLPIKRYIARHIICYCYVIDSCQYSTDSFDSTK